MHTLESKLACARKTAINEDQLVATMDVPYLRAIYSTPLAIYVLTKVDGNPDSMGAGQKETKQGTHTPRISRNVQKREVLARC